MNRPTKRSAEHAAEGYAAAQVLKNMRRQISRLRRQHDRVYIERFLAECRLEFYLRSN